MPVKVFPNGNIVLRLWVASMDGGGDYADLPIIIDGEPTPEVKALAGVLNRLAAGNHPFQEAE